MAINLYGWRYIDYPFENVMFRTKFDENDVFQKFYGKAENPKPLKNSNKLYNDAIQGGYEISELEYLRGIKLSHIELALQIATRKHARQRDKGGDAYILHPLRLMNQCSTENERLVALLHDVLEDSDFPRYELSNCNFPLGVTEAIELLTKNNDIDYQEYIYNISQNELARTIKILDLKDNLNLSRLKTLSEKDCERIKKYQASLAYLENSL